MICCLDTHTLVWFLTGDARLSAKARRAIRESEERFIVPTIVLLEIRYLAAKSRIPVELSDIDTMVLARSDCIIWPMDEHVVHRAPLSLNIHDAIICGSALSYRDSRNEAVCVVTRDQEITEWAGLPVIW